MKSMYYYLGVEGEEVGALPPPCECPSNAECNRGCDRFPNIGALPQADRAVGPADPSPVPGLGHSASIPSAEPSRSYLDSMAKDEEVILECLVRAHQRRELTYAVFSPAWDATAARLAALRGAIAMEARSAETERLGPKGDSAGL